MPTNLFDLLDGIFQGLIWFIYNMAATIGRLAWRPLTAPAQLYARYRRKSVKQVSPWSFIVIGLIWLQMSIPGLFSSSEGDNARNALPLWVQGQGSSATIARLFVESAIAGAVLDVLVRTVASVGGIKDTRRRAYFVAVMEYSIGFILWLIALTTSLLSAKIGIDALEYSLPAPSMIGAVATAFVGSRLLSGGSGLKGRPRLRWIGLYVAVLVLICATVVTQIWIQQNLPAAKAQDLVVLRIRCTAHGSTGTARITIWNSAAKPLFVDGRYPDLVFQPFGDEGRPERWSVGMLRYRQSIVDEQGIAPGATVVRYGLAAFNAPVRTQNGYCRVGQPEWLEPAMSPPDIAEPAHIASRRFSGP